MRAARGPLTPAHPLPVHLLDPFPGAHGRSPLDLAARTGWRFLIRDGEDVVAAAETAEDGSGHSVAYFAEGPYPLSTLRALQQARLHAGPSATTYLPRLLSVPGLYMAALWLHPVLGPTQSPDLLIPLAPAPLGVTAHLPHHAEELLALLALGRKALVPTPA
ncbi:hypothetical protein ACFQZC_31490 [Streptacidiphilus monticola]